MLIALASLCSSCSASKGATANEAIDGAAMITSSAPATATTTTVTANVTPPTPTVAVTTPTTAKGPATNPPRLVELPQHGVATANSSTAPPVTAPAVTVPTVTGHPPVSLPGVAGTVIPGVVDILGVLDNGQADVAGTGMVLSSSGLVVTNNHVVEDSSSFTATEVTSGRTYPATIVGVNPSADIAVLQMVGASGLATVRTGNSADVYPTESVIAIGNVGGAGVPVVTKGTVEATGQQVIVSNAIAGTSEVLTGLIETSTEALPGDSGGPLMDGSGTVIAMVTSGAEGNGPTATNEESYAIPINIVLAVVQRIE